MGGRCRGWVADDVSAEAGTNNILNKYLKAFEKLDKKLN